MDDPGDLEPARFAVLESGKIQAAMVAIPLTRKAKTLGFHALADLGNAWTRVSTYQPSDD